MALCHLDTNFKISSKGFTRILSVSHTTNTFLTLKLPNHYYSGKSRFLFFCFFCSVKPSPLLSTSYGVGCNCPTCVVMKLKMPYCCYSRFIYLQNRMNIKLQVSQVPQAGLCVLVGPGDKMISAGGSEVSSMNGSYNYRLVMK